MSKKPAKESLPAWVPQQTIATKLFGDVELRSYVVSTADELATMAEYLYAMPEVAYDTETSGLVPALGARIVGHAFAAISAPGIVSAFYLPIRHIGEHNDWFAQIPIDDATAAVQRILAAPGSMVGHHAKFDRKLARADGIEIRRQITDTSIEAVIYDENAPSFALKSLAALHVVDSANAEEDLMDAWMKKDARALNLAFKKRKRADDGGIGEPTYLERFGYARTPVLLCGAYAIKDVFYTLMLRHKFAEVRTRYPDLWRREHGVSDVLFDMEWQGLPADEACIRDTHERTAAAVTYWLDRLRAIVGDPEFTPTAAALRVLLFDTLKLEPQKVTKSGRGSDSDQTPSVDREARKLLAQKYPEHASLLHALDQHAIVEKLHATYAGSFLRYYSPTTRSLHPNYNQLEQRDEGGVPVTGRLSSSDPNSQNVASQAIHLWNCGCSKCVKETPSNEGNPPNTVSIRRYFVVPKDCVRVYIDFSQIELRVLAWLCQDPTLVAAFQNDQDLHQVIADDLGISRKVAKQVNFGNSYGMTEIGLATRLPGYYENPEATREEAKRVLDSYFARYRKILTFRDQFASDMRRNGCEFINVFGRPRRIPGINAPERWLYARAQRQMMSSVVSGTSADLMKESMLRCAAILKERDAGLLVQTIHDELVFDLKKQPGWIHTALALKNAMEDWPQFSVTTHERQGIPIKTNMAMSTTTWEAKREVRVYPDGRMEWAE